MTLSEYQVAARRFAQYPKDVNYPYLGLAEEAGEVLGKRKKHLRNGTDRADFLPKLMAELGDTLWYLSAVASDEGLNLEDIANYNLNKLQDRMDRGKIKSEGDNR